jgi:hypothetical protein
MTTLKVDELVKPDMRAVLARTHLLPNLHDLLLPTFEAISNAMHGIEARFGADAGSSGTVFVHLTHQNDPAKFKVVIRDNGVGFTDENYKSFKTPFSGYKLKQHGRGFGRFIAFKVYARVEYLSRYEFFDQSGVRSFRFDIADDKEIRYSDKSPPFDHSGVQVEYSQPLADWHDLIRALKREDVADEIGSHFLPYFLYRWLPTITIQFDSAEPEDITAHFKSVFIEAESGQIKCEIDGRLETLNYSITKVPKTRSFRNHCLLFSAADRIVGSPRDLTNMLGDTHFTSDDGKRYIVIAIVRSEAFESRLNDARTGLNLSAKTVETIVSKISEVIQVTESAQIDKIKREQTTDLEQALKTNPILRIGLKGRSVRDYVAGKPNNWSAQEFVSDLAIERFRESNELSELIARAANDPADYQKSLQDLVGKLDANKKETLAEYVLHRKSVIDLVEAARKFRADGKRAPEDVIHELVFRRFSDNASTTYFEHNLWLIDDLLAFLPYVSSDRTMHGGARKRGDKVTDLAFFDDSMVLGDNDGTTITIVEFKKPSRDDYVFGNPKGDPVLQVMDTLEQATEAGGISKTDGAHFSFVGLVKRFAFIVADHTPSLTKLLRKHDFKNDWNPKIFVRYRDNEQIFIQAFGYDTLIENAKKRNQAFFSVLLGE